MIQDTRPYSINRESLLELLLENTEEGFILLGLDLNIISINASGASILQTVFGKMPMPGMSVLEFSTPERQAYLRKMYDKVFSGETIKYEIALTAPEGAPKTFALHIKPARARGELIGAMVNARDVSETALQMNEQEMILKTAAIFAEKKMLRVALADLLRMFISVHERDAAEIWVANIDHTRLLLKARVNCLEEPEGDSLVRNFGINEGLPGICWKEGVPNALDDLEQNPRFLRKRFANINGFQKAEGIPVMIRQEVVAVIVFFSRKNISSAMPRIAPGVLFQLGNEIIRKDSEDRLNRFFELSPDVLSIAGTDGHFKKLNSSFPRILGYTMEEMLDRPFYDLVHPEDRQPTGSLVEQLANGLTFSYFENRFRCRTGEYRWFAWTSTSLMEEGLIFGVAKDITEKKRTEQLHREMNEVLEKRARQLSASNAELERFAYVASHDLQEPLRMVSSFLQLLQKKYRNDLDEAANQYIHFAVDGAERMKKLILDLLDYSRVGTNPHEYAQVNMNDVVSDTRKNISVAILQNGARIHSEPLPSVRANPVQMRQVFQNILGNAIKYRSEKNPAIHISCTEEEKEFIFRISDNGIGIDPKFSEKIFVIFQRLHNSSQYEGTGIGLAITRKIIEKHGGRIWVEPNSPEGSVFYFSIRKSKAETL